MARDADRTVRGQRWPGQFNDSESPGLGKASGSSALTPSFPNHLIQAMLGKGEHLVDAFVCPLGNRVHRSPSTLFEIDLMDEIAVMASTDVSNPTVLSADAISHLPQESFGSDPGSAHRVLWRNETSMAGVLTVDAGHRIATHAHRAHHHHVWLVDGHANVLAENVGPGSYVHIPRGIAHDIDATSSDGCTVFYLYLAQTD